MRHLFILAPPASGSTLLWRILATSPRAAALPGEGQALVRDVLFTGDRWDPAKRIDWERVRATWENRWPAGRPVRLEKSPPHLVRASQLQSAFPSARFIVMTRNPYAFCEGVKRRHGQREPWYRRYGYFNAARFWVLCAAYQRWNVEHLERVLAFRYDELTEDPPAVCRRILEFVPELETLDPAREFQVFERRSGVANLDREQITRLPGRAILDINAALAGHQDLLESFGFRRLEPAPGGRLRGVRRLFRPMQRLNPNPDMLRFRHRLIRA